MKLETIIQKQDEGLSMMRVLLGATRGISGNYVLVDILPKPADRLEEEKFKKKMASFFICFLMRLY